MVHPKGTRRPLVHSVRYETEIRNYISYSPGGIEAAPTIIIEDISGTFTKDDVRVDTKEYDGAVLKRGLADGQAYLAHSNIELIGDAGPSLGAGFLLGTARLAKTVTKVAGVASGRGSKISGNWLRETHGNMGLSPESITKSLKGKKFTDFDEYRKAFWKEVGKGKSLTEGFNQQSIARMKNGLAPKIYSTQGVGKRTSYELHHKTPIGQGGAVFDAGNIIIVTPQYDGSILSPTIH